MGQARLRGTRAERVVQAHAKAAERERWAPALTKARRDPRWWKSDRPQRRALLVEAAVELGIIAKPEPQA